MVVCVCVCRGGGGGVGARSACMRRDRACAGAESSRSPMHHPLVPRGMGCRLRPPQWGCGASGQAASLNSRPMTSSTLFYPIPFLTPPVRTCAFWPSQSTCRGRTHDHHRRARSVSRPTTRQRPCRERAPPLACPSLPLTPPPPTGANTPHARQGPPFARRWQGPGSTRLAPRSTQQQLSGRRPRSASPRSAEVLGFIKLKPKTLKTLKP